MKSVIPKTYKEALTLLNEGEYKIIAGGTDLMVQNRGWSNTLPTFKFDTLFVLNLNELNYIKEEDGFVKIGSNMNLEQLKDELLCPPLLTQAIEVMASPAIRNIATIAGNIGNASPAGDSLPIFYALNAKVVVASIDGVKEFNIEDFITGPGRKQLNKNEMIIEVKIPIDKFTFVRFDKVGGRKADAISKISFAGATRVENNVLKDLRLTFGAVGPVVVRQKVLEDKYIGLSISELKGKVKEILKDYEPFITPIDDQRSNKEYRKVVALNLLESFIVSL
ncbi:MAG: FAD binding domain-containing protein [Candidatus Izemoplasma sp.]